MGKKLTKPEIRDHIARVKHLKHPYDIGIQVISTIFVALLIFNLGAISTYSEKVVEIDGYSLNLTQNNSANHSISIGNIKPIKKPSIANLKSFLEFSWILMILIYGGIISVIVFNKDYSKYRHEITRLYNLLVGLGIKPQAQKENFFSRMRKKMHCNK